MNQFITEFVTALILAQVLLAIWNKAEKKSATLVLPVSTELPECTPFTKQPLKK